MGLYNHSPSFVKHKLDRERYGDNRRREYTDGRREQAPTIIVNIVNMPQSVAQEVKLEDEITKDIVGQAATAMSELASALNRLLDS